MAEINYSSGQRITLERPHRVYAKAAWADAWTLQPNLACVECQWNAAPAFNTAILRWEVGSVLLPGDAGYTSFGVWTGRGHFVRIDWQCDDGGYLYWVGYIDASDWPTDANGHQSIVCYGLERALALTPIRDAVWYDEDQTRRTDFPLEFNSETGRRDAAENVFADVDAEEYRDWSTRSIVEYLLAEHLPTNTDEVADIPWELDQGELLPDWDTPRIDTRNRTVWDVLNDLVTPAQQLGFTVGSDGATCYVRIFSHLPEALTANGNTLAANPRQHTVAFQTDALAAVRSPIRDPLTYARFADVGGGFDQVICRGARRKTICTLEWPFHWTEEWTESQAERYEVAASVEAGYASLSDPEKRQRDAIIRGTASLRPVYRDFKLTPDWDYKLDDESIFPDNTFPRTVEFTPRLPIKPGIEWDGSVDVADFDRQGSGRPILFLWPDPTETAEWIDNAAIEQLSELIDSEWDFTVRVQATGRRLQLHVDGAPQHAIALSKFTPLSADHDSLLAFTDARATVCLAEDRFCEGVYPAEPAEADVVRRLVVDLGEGYQQIYIAPDTITEVTDFGGSAKTSDGGTLVDDSEQLASLAEVIAGSVLPNRKTVHWSSLRKISAIAVGDLITTAGGATINAPVTAIRIQAGVTVNRPAAAAEQSFEVYRGSGDPLGILRVLGGLEPGSELPRRVTPASGNRRQSAARSASGGTTR